MVGYSLPAAHPHHDHHQKPAWLRALLSEKFFSACGMHANLKKNERNIFCLDCALAICQHCIPSHPQPHGVLQIRRYVYHDVIRMQDVRTLIDCAFVQPYIINSAKVVFLNQRPQPRPSKGFGNVCETCERSLQDSFKYCSLACKVDAIVEQGKDLQALVRLGNPSQQSDSNASSSGMPSHSARGMVVATKGVLMNRGCCNDDDDDDDEQEQLSPNSVHHGPALHSPSSSSSTANDGLLWEAMKGSAMATKKLIGTQNGMGATSHMVRLTSYQNRMQACNNASHQCAREEAAMVLMVMPALKRRKGIPRRSPIF